MIRKLVCLVLSACMVAGSSAIVQARSGKGELQVVIGYEDGLIHDGEVALYPVGIPSGKDFLLAADFGGGMVKQEDVSSDALAAWLAELADTEGLKRLLDADGRACYSNLPDGLYLLRQTQAEEGQTEFAPMLVSIPWEGSWTVGVFPMNRRIVTESPQTGQFMSPLLGAMGIVLSVLALGACLDRFRRK